MPKGTPDLSEFEKLSKPADQRQLCKVGIAREQLAERERAQLDAAFAAHDRITVGGIVAWLKGRDHKVSVSAATYHRRKGCRCHAE